MLQGVLSFIVRTVWPYRRTELNYMLNLLEDVEGKRILDYGCNTGYFTNMIYKQCPNNTVCGADINPYALRAATKRFKHLAFHTVDDDFFEKHTFDIIIISHVLEHIKNRKAFMKNIANILADDGKLIIAIPQERIRGDATVFQILFNACRLKFENPHVVKLYYEDLEDLLTTIGLKIDDYTYTNYLYPFKSNSLLFHAWSLVVLASVG